MSRRCARMNIFMVLLVLWCTIDSSSPATSKPLDKPSTKEIATAKDALAPKETPQKVAPAASTISKTEISERAAKIAKVTSDDSSASGDSDAKQTNRRSLDIGAVENSVEISRPTNALTGNSIPVSGRVSYNNNGLYSSPLQDVQGRQNYYTYPTTSAAQPYYAGTPTNYPSSYNNWSNLKSSGQAPQYPYYPQPQAYNKGTYTYPTYVPPQPSSTKSSSYTYPAYVQPQSSTKSSYTYPATTYPASTYPASVYPLNTYPAYTYPASASYQTGYPNYNSQYPTYYVQNPSASQGSYGYYGYPSYQAYTATSQSSYYPRYY